MKIILLKDVKKVGRKFEVKNVADGLAINKLIPMGMAIQATEGNIKGLQEKIKIGENNSAQIEDSIKKAIASLKDGKVVITGKTNDKGHLFAGVHKAQIIEEFKKVTGVEISEDSIKLEKPLKEVGEHKIKITLGDKVFEFVVEIKGTK
ncbi:MAG: 50S ribosomal protein L9 [Candidatus Paceibacterota bacterium]|jgi:large subunit ribosomal protein L9